MQRIDIQLLFFNILVNLNRRDFKKVRHLAKKSKLCNRITGCDNMIESIIFKGHTHGLYYYIVYYYDKTIKYYQILTPDLDSNLFNYTPSDLIRRAISNTEFHVNLEIPKQCRGRHKLAILLDYKATDPEFHAFLEKVEKFFDLEAVASQVNASNVYKATEKFLRDGYRYIVAPAFSSNLEIIMPLIHKHKNTYFISPLATDSILHSDSNLIKFALVDRYFSQVLDYIAGSEPFLIFTQNNNSSMHLAAEIASHNPNSVIVPILDNVSYLVQTQTAISNNPTLTHIFFAQTTGIQDYLSAVPSTTFPVGYLFYASDAFQVLNLLWDAVIFSILPYYSNTNIALNEFPEANYFDYSYADAMYFLQQIINVGYRALGSLTGVVEQDDEGNRLWYSFAIMTYDPTSHLWNRVITINRETPWTDETVSIHERQAFIKA